MVFSSSFRVCIVFNSHALLDVVIFFSVGRMKVKEDVLMAKL